MESRSLDGKVAFITGGGTGIGAGIARAYARGGRVGGAGRPSAGAAGSRGEGRGRRGRRGDLGTGRRHEVRADRRCGGCRGRPVRPPRHRGVKRRRSERIRGHTRHVTGGVGGDGRRQLERALEHRQGDCAALTRERRWTLHLHGLEHELSGRIWRRGVRRGEGRGRAAPPDPGGRAASRQHRRERAPARHGADGGDRSGRRRDASDRARSRRARWRMAQGSRGCGDARALHGVAPHRRAPPVKRSTSASTASELPRHAVVARSGNGLFRNCPRARTRPPDLRSQGARDHGREHPREDPARDEVVGHRQHGLHAGRGRPPRGRPRSSRPSARPNRRRRRSSRSASACRAKRQPG